MKTPSEIVDIVCEEFKITREKVCKKERSVEAVEARAAIFFFTKILHREIPLKAIGIKTIGRDLHHTSIIHAIKKCLDTMSVYAEYKKKMRTIAVKLEVVL